MRLSRLLSRLLFPLPVLALAACLGDGDDEGSGRFSISASMEVLAIDRANHTITTRTTMTECREDGTGAIETKTSVEGYAVKDGKLILWNEEECNALILAGSSTDIVGTWKGNGLETESAIPAEYRPATCPAELPPDTADTDMLSGLSVTYAVSEKKIVMKGTGEVCPGEDAAAGLAESGLTLISTSCSDVLLQDPAGSKVAVHFNYGENRMGSTMSYKGKSCGFSIDMAVPGHAIDCAKNKASMEGYMQCVQAMAGAKVSAGLRKGSAKLF